MSLPELEQRRGQIRAELEILQRECGRKLPKGPEPPRNKVHWDYLLEESVWMANDFKLERKWKMAVAKKLSRAVMRYHAQQQTKAARAEKQAELLRRKLAAFVSRDVKKFWHKAQSVIDQQRKHLAAVKEQELLDSQLEALVGKTEQYSARLAQGLSAYAINHD
jgi:E1A-binding protein p400